MLFLANLLFPDALAVHPETWATRNTRSSKDTYPIWNNRFTVSIKVQSSTPATPLLCSAWVQRPELSCPWDFWLLDWKCHITHNDVKQEISPVQGPVPGKAKKTLKHLKSLNKMIHKSQQKLNTGLSRQRERPLMWPRGIHTTICARRTWELELSRTQLTCLNLT